MVRLSATCVGLLSAAASAHAATLNVTSLLPDDSIVQNTTAALAPWQKLCVRADSLHIALLDHDLTYFLIGCRDDLGPDEIFLSYLCFYS